MGDCLSEFDDTDSKNSCSKVLSLEIVGVCTLRQVWLQTRNKPAKGKCLARKAEIKKCLSSGIEGCQFLFFEYK